ncbi:multiple monosaccharide ABC transporter substrate-binding protein [Kineosporia succinea]|uniref:Multiple sugar transport system substrate-binding protein n=1 Tax=Kineosporia succinea TaxID=84632 RepID=A0ABT9PDV5_9ACTN|nr:multiple monosaccharide ABC transporter substrate-binding protein [Kineosporia succinea]MDP9830877.1 putative multiple sugar transport system substrate-binding protein [Kineosporia succinea]
MSVSAGLIGVAMPTTGSDRWIADGENMKKQFELLGYQTDVQFAEDKVDDQIAQIQAMVDGGAKAVIVGAVDGSALTGVLAKAAAADVEVIAYDRLIRDTPDIDYYASFDNFRVGVLQADYLVKTLKLTKAGGPYNLELFAGDAKDNNAGFFFDGAMSVLQPYISSGKLEIRSGQTAFAKVTTEGWNGEVAGERMTSLLNSDYAGTDVDAVLSPYDGISRGIIASLQKKGYGTRNKPLPVITGQDAELDSVKAIADGTQGQTVYKDSRELAKVAVQMTDSLLSGGTPEVNDTKQYNNGVKDVASFLLQPVSVDKDNYESVLVDGGYYTADQIGN